MANQESQEKVDRETAEALERYRAIQRERIRAANFFGCPVHKVVRDQNGAWTVR